MEIEVKKFIKKARKYAKENDLFFSYDDKSAKGSHGKIFIGDRATTIIGVNKVMRAGLYHAVCKQLGINPKELDKF
jgi:mRNA interferase HicA